MKPLFAVLFLQLAIASAQELSKRQVDVTVTDPQGRFVTGLERESFQVVENGVPRPLTDFSNRAIPISLAIVADGPVPDVGPLFPGDQLMQATSMSSALDQLTASKNKRKLIVNLGPPACQTIPAGVQLLQTNRAGLVKALIELHNRYRIEFEPSQPSASFAVLLKQPVGLPHLELSWK